MDLNNDSVLEAARKLNSEMKTLITEEDDLPTPILGSPIDSEVKTKIEDTLGKEVTTPDAKGGR